MKAVILPLAVAVVLAAALVGIRMLTAGGSQAQTVNGDLLLDWAVGDNTDVSVGVIDTSCKTFSAGTVVRIDVIADNAVDWAGIDFVFIYPPGSTGVLYPGPR